MSIHQSTSAFRAIEKVGRVRPFRDKFVPRRKFGAVARLLWPHKTAAHLAAIGSADERTGKRWMRGESVPPLEVVIACVQEMFREQK